MKYSHFVVPCLLLASLSVCSNATILFDGIVSHWTFDRGMGKVVLDDISANDGQMLIPQWTAGINDFALKFDGRDYIRIPNTASLCQNGQSWSVGFWMKSDRAAQTTMIISKRQENVKPFKQYSIGISGGNSHSWGLGRKITFLFRENDHIEKGGYTTDDIDFSQWTQVFVVLDKIASTVRVYINGSQVPVTLDNDWAFPNINNADNLQIGGCPYFYNYPLYHGSLDEVCIYNRVLTEQEILLNYNYYGAEAIGAAVNFIPASINLSGKAQSIKVELSLSNEHSINDIQLDSILLEGAVSPCLTMHKMHSNSLILTFSQQQIEKYLESGNNELHFSARLSDQRQVEGIASLYVIK